MVNGLILIIEQIPGQADQVRLFTVNFFHHLLHLIFSNGISQMQIRYKNQSQVFYRAGLFHRQIVFTHTYIPHMDNPINADSYYYDNGASPCNGKNTPRIS